VQASRPVPLDSTSEPPPIFDGTTRLYVAYICPFAQRVWITRNYKGLQDKIKLVALELHDRPAWYKEKVYPENKVPALEHENKVIGESLDLVRYLDNHFEGPALLPDDPVKREFAEELISYIDTCLGIVYGSFRKDPVKEAGLAFDHLEEALHKFDDGPFFLGQFSMVDIVYAPFFERFHIFLKPVFNYDFTSGRPKLAAYMEELEKIDAYTQTKCDAEKLLAYYKTIFLGQK